MKLNIYYPQPLIFTNFFTNENYQFSTRFSNDIIACPHSHQRQSSMKYQRQENRATICLQSSPVIHSVNCSRRDLQASLCRYYIRRSQGRADFILFLIYRRKRRRNDNFILVCCFPCFAVF